MSGKHTPGPWLLQAEHDGEWSVWARQPHTGTLATFYCEDINGLFPAENNARLCAAAPDLLASLVELLEPLEAAAKALGSQGKFLDMHGEAAFDRARAAIAKARGEA